MAAARQRSKINQLQSERSPSNGEGVGEAARSYGNGHTLAPPTLFVPRLLAGVISMSAPAVDIVPPSPTTVVAIAIARSVRRGLVNTGFTPGASRTFFLPVPYVHIVFTLPPQLAPLALQNKKVIYGLLLRLSAETLLEVARNPRHLGAEIGFFQCVAHLEPETPTSSSCPLRCPRRWTLARSHPLDSIPSSILSPYRGASARVSRQVRRGS